MKPWMIDAGNFTPTENTRNEIFLNRKVKKYLHVGDHENKFFLIGPKGLGKTLLIRYKSYLYRNTDSLKGSYKFNSTNLQLVENIRPFRVSLSKNDLLKFKNHSIWVDIWLVTLLVVVCKTYGLTINEDLEKKLDGGKLVSTVLFSILQDRSMLSKYTSYINELFNLSNEIKSGVAIFIDDIDQAFGSVLKNHHFKDEYYEGDTIPSIELWKNVQMGLMAAIYSINRSNNHIKIFATFRSEAFTNFKSDMKHNYKEYAVELSYTKAEIKSILCKHIDLMDEEDYIIEIGDSIQKFLGFSEMPHPFAKNQNGVPRRELVFDFLYRHTYGRPREIVLFGKELFDNLESYKEINVQDRIDNIRMLINEKSNELFKVYKREIIPYFDENKLKNLIQNLTNNVIVKTEIERIDEKTKNYFYNLGLLGYAALQNINEKKYVQRFLAPAKYNYSEDKGVPIADYYLIHPTLDKSLINQIDFHHFYNSSNIIGNGNPFYQNKVSFKRYYPKRVSGKRWEQAPKGGSHERPLVEYYDFFFMTDNIANKEMQMRYYEEPHEILLLIAKLYYCSLLQQRDKENSKSCLQKEYFIKKLNSELRLKREYVALLREPHENYARNMFTHRLIGRLVCLGCYIYLGLSCRQIHRIFLDNDYSFNELEVNTSNGAFKYLQNAFFVYGLTKDRRTNDVKNVIFEQLSDHEKATLIKWRTTLASEVSKTTWITEDEKIWILNEVIQKEWKKET